jgi:hypothetical protein
MGYQFIVCSTIWSFTMSIPLRIICTATLLLVSSTFAAAPSKPREFTATGATTDTPGQYKAVLSWLPSQWERESDRPTGYYVYRASGATEDLSQYTRIATIPAGSRDPQAYNYTDQPLDSGTYSYYITAYNSDGESPRSTIRVVTVPPNSPPSELLRFVSQPPTRGQVGSEYRYQARAATPIQGVTIRYQLISGPDGMTIDETTGLVTWTPHGTGSFRVVIKATIEIQGRVISAMQDWKIVVGDEEHDGCILVEGIVRDTSGEPVSSGVVIAYRAITRHNEIVWVQVGKANVGDIGTFHMRLPAGQYKFVTEGRNYRAQWYEQSSTADSATVLTFECGVDSVVELVFVVTPRETEHVYTVSGRVTAEESGSGIAAWVKFMAVVNHHEQHADDDRTNGPTFTAETNAEGYYEIRLSNRYTYIARAIPRSDAYLPLYYDGTSNIAAATRITLSSNREGINFALPNRPTYTGGFGGQLVDSAGNGVPGWAVACRVLTNTNDRGDRIRRYRTVETDMMGNYRFDGLEPGVYIVLGIPRTGDLVPGFCVLGEYATLRWRTATRIEVGEAMLTVQYGIKLRARTGVRGIVRLDGWIRGRAERIKGGVGDQGEVPVAGALVAVVSSEGIEGYAITQDDGYYAIEGLVPLTGQLIVDHPEYESSIITLVMKNTSKQSQNATLDPVQVSSVISDEHSSITLSPNPASDAVQIDFGTLEGKARIEVLTLLGTIVASVENSGPHVTLSTEALTAGVYAVRITTQQMGMRTIPLIVVR